MASTAINATVISKFFLGPVQVFYQLYDLAIKWARDIIFNISTPLSLPLCGQQFQMKLISFAEQIDRYVRYELVY